MRNWEQARALQTAVDMALLQTDLVLRETTSWREVWRTYANVVRSVPRAVRNRRDGYTPPNPQGPFKSLTARNLARCYAHSRVFQLIAVAAWVFSNLLPLHILRFLFR